MILSFDTETTGLDPWHGCRPFIVSMLDDTGSPADLWRWRVDPFSREVERFSNPEKVAIHDRLAEADTIVCHNAKFDIRMLEMSGVPLPPDLWDKIQDTILMSHCVSSAGPHELKELALRHLDILDDDEEATRVAAIAARRVGKKLGWRIADRCDPHWPTTKSGREWWKADLWMPGELLLRESDRDDVDPDWVGVTDTYAVRDAERTLGLWWFFSERLSELDKWDQYEVRRRNLQATYEMENRGLSLRRFMTTPVREKHSRLAAIHQSECFRVVDNKIDNLNSPKQLASAMFNILDLPIIHHTEKSGQPATDKDTLAELRTLVRPTSREKWFLKHLLAYRKRDHAADTVESYELGCLPYADPRQKRFAVLHPNLNLTATATTRGGSNNPNGQNIAKGEGVPKEEKFNLRDLFGPILGRVWYDHDYSNIELRIFAMLSGEKEFLRAFERGESVHLIIAKELYPRIYCEDFKDRYPQLYQWVKNGNFALTYGAGQKTADATYHLPGAYKIIRRRFRMVDSFMDQCIAEAKQYGFVTTLGGYRLDVPQDRLYTTAVDYKVQGSAGYAMNLAMNHCMDYLHTLNDHHMIIQVHDELLHDVPEKHDPKFPFDIAKCMEKSGDVLGLKLPVEMCRIRISWDQYEDIKPLKATAV